MSARCPLGVCDGSGWIDDEQTRTVTPCKCRPQVVAARRVSALSGTIPKRYRGVSFDRPPVTDMPGPQVQVVSRFARSIDERLAEGRGLWFVGGVGTGKTTLAMLVSRAAIDAGHTVAVYSLPRLLAEIRATFDVDAAGAYVGLLDRLTEVDLLHIDDLGAEKTSAWVLEQLYAIINARYEAERSVVVTTNLDTEPLGAQIGMRTVSRLEEMCEMVPLYGRDRRVQEVTDLRERPGGPPEHGSDPSPADLRLA